MITTLLHNSAGKWLPLTIVSVALCFNCGCRSLNHWWNNGLRVGPNYCEPDTRIADSFSEVESPRINPSEMGDPEWWRVFNDPVLNELIEGVYDQNLSLKQAVWRVEEARAIRDVQRGNLFPQQNTATGSFSRNQNSAFSGLPLTTSFWAVGFNSAWEVDLWGRLRRNVTAANANLDASVHDYDFVLVTLIADVASLYIQMRSAEERITLAKKNVESFKGSLKIVKDQREEGVASPLDVVQAESNLLATQALIPRLEFAHRQALNALTVLLGIPPSDITELGSQPGMLPKIPAEVLVGIPAELVTRRPDIRAAERRLHAGFEAIGITEADLYPTFAISGNLGYQSPSLKNLISSSSFTGSVAPAFQWNILNFGRIRNQIRANRARFEQLQLEYQNQVLIAQQEAETSMYDFMKSYEEYELNLKNEKVTRESARIVVEQFVEGGVDFGRVFVVQSNLVQVQDQLVANKANIALALINTYRSLGGGWEIRCNDEEALVPKQDSERVRVPVR